ncbi:MAG TPA: hypothetical protein VL693_08920 [Vicinamibacterales bacterium]|nr:hypothetical protein [Vicinamibacterales bacterium]
MFPLRPGLRRAFLLLIAAAIAGATFIYRFNTLDGRLGGFDNDHFIALVRSVAVLNGERPIRDFTDTALEALWPAPTYSLSAAAQRMLGPSLRSEALLTTGMLSLGVAGLFLVSAEFGSMAVAALLALLAAALAPALYNYPKIVPYVLGVWMMLGYARRPTRTRAIALGVSVGIGALFRHDHGLYLGLAAATLVLLVETGTQRYRQLSVLAATCLLMLLPGIAFAQMHGGFITYLRQCLETSRQEASRTAKPGARFVIDWSQPLLVRSAPADPPMPRVAVRWSSTLTPQMRRVAESELELGEPIRRQDDWNWSYAILQPSRDRLAALVRDTRVVDTDGVNRVTFTIMQPAPPDPLSWFTELRRWRIAPGLLTPVNAVPWLYVVAWLVVISAVVMIVRPALGGVVVITEVPRAAIQAVCVLGLLMLFGLLRTANPSRLADMSVPVGILGCWLVSTIAGAMRHRPRSTQVLVAVTVAALVGLSAGAVVVVADTAHQLRVAGLPSVNGVRQQSTTVWRRLGALPANLNGIDEDLQRTSTYLRRCTTPDDRLFIAGNLPEIYYFAERRFAAGQNTFFSSFYSSATLQQTAIDRWRLQSVPIALTAAGKDFDDEFAKDYPLLAGYLRVHYRRAGTFAVEAGRLMDIWIDQRRRFSADAVTGLPCAQPDVSTSSF